MVILNLRRSLTDRTSFLGFCILENFASNQDLGGHNWQCGGQIEPKPYFDSPLRHYGGWKFFASDDDVIFQTTPYSTPVYDPGHWYARMLC
jgi:hypothetical protein